MDRDAFISRWGELGRAWGLPRGAAQVHALLLTADEPMDAEAIAGALGIARSNVSTSIKELRGYGVIRLVAEPGARRERFAALDDPWQAAANIAAARKAREYDDAMRALSDVAETAPKGEAQKRLAAYAEFATTANDWAEQMRTLPKGPWRALFKLGAEVTDVLTVKKKKKKAKG